MDGITLRVMAVGELVKRVSQELRAKADEVAKKLDKPLTEWRGLSGIRDFIAHQYDVVDFEIVYEIATKEIKPLKEIFEYMINNK